VPFKLSALVAKATAAFLARFPPWTKAQGFPLGADDWTVEKNRKDFLHMYATKGTKAVAISRNKNKTA